MSNQWTLAEGIEKLFANLEDPKGIEDLATYGRQITLDVSFAVTDEMDVIEGVKVDEPMKGISVILSAFPPDDGRDHDEDTWMFSKAIFPDEGETLPELAKRIAEGLGVKVEERIWEDGQQ